MIPEYRMMVETDHGQFTRSSGITIDLHKLTANGDPIKRLIFYVEQSDLPTIVLDATPGMELIFEKHIVIDYARWERDRSHLIRVGKILEKAQPPLRRFQIIGKRLLHTAAVNRIDLLDGTVTLEIR